MATLVMACAAARSSLRTRRSLMASATPTFRVRTTAREAALAARLTCFWARGSALTRWAAVNVWRVPPTTSMVRLGCRAPCVRRVAGPGVRARVPAGLRRTLGVGRPAVGGRVERGRPPSGGWCGGPAAHRGAAGLCVAASALGAGVVEPGHRGCGRGDGRADNAGRRSHGEAARNSVVRGEAAGAAGALHERVSIRRRFAPTGDLAGGRRPVLAAGACGIGHRAAALRGRAGQRQARRFRRRRLWVRVGAPWNLVVRAGRRRLALPITTTGNVLVTAVGITSV
jgi:hypothetical protein